MQLISHAKKTWWSLTSSGMLILVHATACAPQSNHIGSQIYTLHSLATAIEVI